MEEGLAAPDVDNNCQIEVVIYAIDGAYNIGGYFAPGMSASREAIFIDIDDAPLSWSSNPCSRTTTLDAQCLGSLRESLD